MVGTKGSPRAQDTDRNEENRKNGPMELLNSKIKIAKSIEPHQHFVSLSSTIHQQLFFIDFVKISSVY